MLNALARRLRYNACGLRALSPKSQATNATKVKMSECQARKANRLASPEINPSLGPTKCERRQQTHWHKDREQEFHHEDQHLADDVERSRRS